jgi:hypothetical protein
MTMILPIVLQGFLQGLQSAQGFGTVDAGLSRLPYANIIGNLTDLLLGIATTVALAVIIWAGLTYILALGDEARASKAKRVLLYAIIGLAIVGTVRLISDIVKSVIGFGGARPINDVRDAMINILLNFMQILIAPAAVFAFAALLLGGYMYITSLGDEARASRGKRVIAYAILGLIIIGLAGILVNAIVNLLP